MKPKVAIIGRGNVGTSLQQGFSRVGYEVKTVGREPERVGQTAEWGEIIVLAVPFPNIDAALKEIGSAANGKVLLDVTNALTADYQLALGCTTSSAEEIQKQVPSAKVVKAFNTVFAKNQSSGHVKGQQLTLFVAGDDEKAKQQVLSLGHDLGFDPVDAGSLKNARWLETLGYLQIQLGYSLNMGPDIGLRLIH